MHVWSRFDDMRAGGYDPAARIAEMDRDGVDAEVLYPTPRLAQGLVATKDVDFHLALVRAVQRLAVRVRGYAPERFAGLMLLPNRGAQSAVAEIERVAGRAGYPRRRDGLLPERHVGDRPRGRRGLRLASSRRAWP